MEEHSLYRVINNLQDYKLCTEHDGCNRINYKTQKSCYRCHNNNLIKDPDLIRTRVKEIIDQQICLLGATKEKTMKFLIRVKE